MNDILKVIWMGIGPEIQSFFVDLNWTFVLMFIIVLYGVSYKIEFDWFNRLMSKWKLDTFKSWLTGVFLGLIFCFFRWKSGNTFDSEYIAQLLRSWLCVVVFSSVLIDGVVRLLKFVGKRIDDKENKLPS
jgi:hypothetical protein